MPARRRPPRPPPIPPDERPIQIFRSTLGLGDLVHDIRRGMMIRQEDLAVRARVSRQWLVDLERGKPTLEIALVLRALEALGLEFFVRPTDPLPSWIFSARSAADARKKDIARRRAARQPQIRGKARARRMMQNYPTVRPDLE